jgi:DNA-binding transcriptional MerR regulator
VTFYSPGQAAEKTGFSLDTLRYYEKIGLLAPIGRTAGGRRRFTETDVRWLLLLRCLRETGMPIAQMLRFVEFSRLGERTTADRISLLEAHNQQIDTQIERLRANQRQIQGKISYYRSLRPSAVQDSSEVKNDGDRAVVQQGNLHVGAEDAGFDVGAEVTQRLHHGGD